MSPRKLTVNNDMLYMVVGEDSNYGSFEKNGVLKDINDEASVIENINTETYKSLIEQKIISDGMLPKLKNCFHAIINKVYKTFWTSSIFISLNKL